MLCHMTGIQEDVSDISRNISNIAIRHHNQESQAILDWLTTIDYFSQQNDFIRRQQEGTVNWLIQSNEFQQWESGKKNILFCPGIPGAGKTIITSVVIDYLFKKFRNEPNIGIAFIYCNFRRQQEQQPIDLFLCSMLKQLSQRLPSLPEYVIKLYKNHERDQTRPSLKEISMALRTAIIECSRTFIIIDALDEYEAANRTELLSEIFEIQETTNSNLFVTSRFIPDVEDRFTRRSAIVLEIQATPDDVQRYVDSNMHKLPSFVSHNPDLQDEIKSEIVKAVRGMYVFLFMR